VTGLLGIYGDGTAFLYNYASGNGGGVYQYGGSIEAISSSSADPDISGFQYDIAGSGDGQALYLTELENAHIDLVVNSGDSQIYLHSTIPPSEHTYWSSIAVARVSDGDLGIDSNWPYE
jgi:hypothetical protein